MYPVMDHFGMNSRQGMPYPPPQRTLQPQMSLESAGNPVRGVPFKLSPEIASDTDTEISRYQINELMSFITNYEQDSIKLDYDFKLERSLLNE